MTTNERMNSYRYKHFQDPKTGVIRSPFNRGRVQNLVDFARVRVPGFYPPDKKNWKNIFTVDHTDDHELLIRSNPQYV